MFTGLFTAGLLALSGVDDSALTAPASPTPSSRPPLLTSIFHPSSVVDHGTIDIDLPALKYFCEGHQTDLRRYFESSPDWRVGVIGVGKDRQVVASRKLERRLLAFRPPRIDSPEIRITFVFEAIPRVPRTFAACITEAAPDAGKTRVAICDYSQIPTQRVSQLQIGTPGLWLTVKETDDSGDLAETSHTLAVVERELSLIRESLAKDLEATLAGHAKTGTPEFVIDDEEKQILHLTAWLNPGEPGTVTVRAKDAQSHKKLTISHPHHDAHERIGYSDDPKKLFFANSRITINELDKGWNSSHEVVLELWFKPDSGDAARLLISKQQRVSGWER